MTSSLIAHLDADCFYVSCERIRSPALCGLPVGVLGNQGACVIAKSYEMKHRGVTTGEPIWEAVAKCPEGIYIKRDFRWYEAISRRMLELLREVSPAVEYYSIDEMFFDARRLSPDSKISGRTLTEAARALQRRILDEIGIPVSIGVAASKTLAKLASDSSKPLGCVVLLDEEEIERLLRRLPTGEISGVGSRSQKKLAERGIKTCWDFIQADRRLIRNLLTVRGETLWWELRGTASQPLAVERPPRKGLSRGGSLGEATADPERLGAWLARNTERLLEELDYYRILPGRLALALVFKEGGGWFGRVNLSGEGDCFSVLMAAGGELLAEGCRYRRLVTGMHLLAEELRYRHVRQLSLLPEADGSARRLDHAKRYVNERSGRFAVRSGRTLWLKDIYRDTSNEYDICDVRGKICF